MRPMLIAAPLVAALLGAPLAAAQTCARPADLSAFGVASLKSQLMVTALTCDVREKYNAFVLRFRTDLMAQERALQSYFARGFGHKGQQQHDDYITQLANTESEAGIPRDGTLYCQRNAGLLDEVLSPPNGTSLTSHAASKNLAQPVVLPTCATPQVTLTRDARPGRASRPRPVPASAHGDCLHPAGMGICRAGPLLIAKDVLAGVRRTLAPASRINIDMTHAPRISRKSVSKQRRWVVDFSLKFEDDQQQQVSQQSGTLAHDVVGT